MSCRFGKITQRDMAEEIVWRAAGPDGTLGYVDRLSDPPTHDQLIRLAAFRILRQPVAIVPAPYACRKVGGALSKGLVLWPPEPLSSPIAIAADSGTLISARYF